MNFLTSIRASVFHLAHSQRSLCAFLWDVKPAIGPCKAAENGRALEENSSTVYSGTAQYSGPVAAAVLTDPYSVITQGQAVRGETF